MNSTYGIIDYSVNSLCAYISHQTNTPFNQVKQKPQITYLSNYLHNFIDWDSADNQKIQDIVIVYENNYIDKHYLEDYSAYYASCFANYKKTCSRLHFFKNIKRSEDTKEDRPYIEFEKLSNGEDSDYSQDNYLGFIILRPIPYTFFANICLKAYKSDKNRNLLTKENTSSLFGQTYKINSMPFQEQDRAISACATVSLWTFYQSSSINCNHSLPSPNQITKSAYPEKHGYTREFPSAGLSTKMICRSLRHYGFTPEKYQFGMKESNDTQEKPEEVKKKNISLLKEYLYTYSSSNIPLILGITVKNINNNEIIGEHAVTVVGHKVNTTLANVTDDMMFSKYLEKLYTHDDRYGAFMRMEIASDTLNVSLDTESDVSENALFEDVSYEIDSIIIGIYHKIRVPYVRIKTIVNTLSAGLLSIFHSKGTNNIQSEIEWDIKLELNNSIKEDIKNSDIENKTKYLAMSLPKYIWTATILISGKRVIKLLFDATDIEQGYIFLGAIPISETVKLVFDLLFDLIKKYTTNYMNKYNSSEVVSRESLFGFYEYFKNETSTEDVLNTLYGYPKMPRYIKSPETKNDVIIKKDISADKNELDITMKYIWLIDEQGILRYDIEDVDNIGHPTLTNGKPARIGGELIYDGIKECWMVNGFSGRFSKNYTPEKRRTYIENAIKHQLDIYLDEKFEQEPIEIE